MSAPDLNSGLPRWKDVLVGSLAVICATLSAVLWWQHGEIDELRKDAAARLAAAVKIRPATARTLPVTPFTAGRANAGGRGVEDDPDLGPPAARPGLDTLFRAPRRGSALSQLADNADFRRALDLQRQAVLDVRFGELFRRLNLSPAQLAEFKRLLAEKENVALDVVAVNDTLPDGPLPPADLRTSMNSARAQVDSAIRDSLGDDRYAIYRDYAETLPQRATVAQLAQRLSYTNTPLSPTQAESLVHILAAHTPPETPAENTPPVSMVVGAGAGSGTSVVQTVASTGSITNAAVNESQTVLAAPQVAALREIQGEQQASMAAYQFLFNALQNGATLPIGVRTLVQ